MTSSTTSGWNVTKALEGLRGWGRDRLWPIIRDLFWQRGDVQFVAHVCLLLGLFMVVRPIFAAAIPEQAYAAPSVLWDIFARDVDTLLAAARRQRPTYPRLAFLILPTLLLLLSKQRIRWSQWQQGEVLRGLIFCFVFTMGWASTTFDYNMYFDRGHFLDRAAILILGVLAWHRPLALPWFSAFSLVMIREADWPLGHDDFDWRPLAEVLFVTSCFIWLSFVRSLKTKHLLFVITVLMGAYYWRAGWAKIHYGPKWSWVFENKLSNFAVSSYSHGWLGFLDESTFITFAQAMSRLDVVNALYSLFVVELGVIVFIFIHPKVARWYWLVAASLHTGIFVFTGIFFWKWLIADVGLWYFLGRLAPVHRQIFKHKAVLVFGVLLLYYSGHRTYLNPQNGVAWYDSKLTARFLIHAIDEDGERHLVDPATITPMDTRVVMEDFCYLAPDQRRITSIYGTTGNLRAVKALEDVKTEAELHAVMNKYGGRCKNPGLKARLETLLATYFRNTNAAGGRKHRWLSAVGRPDHLWVWQREPTYDFSKKIVRLEIWRVWYFYDGQRIHRWNPIKVTEVEVEPPAQARPVLSPPSSQRG